MDTRDLDAPLTKEAVTILLVLMMRQPARATLFPYATLSRSGADLATPAHERVEPGAVHRANKGVLYIDEIRM